MAENLHVGAGAFARNPAGVVFGRGDFAIERHGALERHERPAGLHEVEKGFVEFFGSIAVCRGHFHCNGGRAQAAEAFTCHERIRIFGSDNDFGDSCRDEGVGTRSGAAGVRAGFESHIDGGALCLLTRFFQGQDFRMLQTGPGVETAAHDFAIAHNHRAHHGIGAGERRAPAGEGESFGHVVGRHAGCF